MTLNNILKQETCSVGGDMNSNKNQELVAKNPTCIIGNGIVDWWTVVEQTSPSEAWLNRALPDGRHFRKCPNLVFFNILLNAMYHDRRLLRPQHS